MTKLDNLKMIWNDPIISKDLDAVQFMNDELMGKKSELHGFLGDKTVTKKSAMALWGSKVLLTLNTIFMKPQKFDRALDSLYTKANNTILLNSLRAGLPKQAWHEKAVQIKSMVTLIGEHLGNEKRTTYLKQIISNKEDLIHKIDEKIAEARTHKDFAALVKNREIVLNEELEIVDKAREMLTELSLLEKNIPLVEADIIRRKKDIKNALEDLQKGLKMTDDDVSHSYFDAMIGTQNEKIRSLNDEVHNLILQESQLKTKKPMNKEALEAIKGRIEDMFETIKDREKIVSNINYAKVLLGELDQAQIKDLADLQKKRQEILIGLKGRGVDL